jgi:dienelactone hydrolase
MRRAQRATAAFVVVAVCASSPVATAQSVDTIKIERQARGTAVVLPVSMHWPKTTAGKVPAIIIVHGSGGVRAERELAYARRFNELGLAAVVVDSFTPRGVQRTVNDQRSVTDAEMLGDAIAVLNAVMHNPRIDAARIGLIGFSKGGTVAIKAALRRYMKDAGESNFALLIALYPWCGEMPIDFTPAGAPLTMLLGGSDAYVGTASCREFAQKFKAAGGRLTLTVYDGARHDWDFPGSTAWTQSRAQNSSKCIYEEVQAGKWIERSTKIVTYDKGKPTAEAGKARAACMTIGASGGYDATTAKRSWQDIAVAVKTAFRLD